MAINFNTVQDISWAHWIRIPHNKKLYESNPTKARRKYMEEEAELIESILLQERIQQERQAEINAERQRQIMIASEKQQALSRMLREATQNQSDVDNLNPAPGTGASGAGGFTLNSGIGNFAIGTHLNKGQDTGYASGAFLSTHGSINTNTSDEGFERFTVR
tara:strand:+ start:27 stop:512 length:486 start_codon:yes stop_codon:yes gene_type:complete